MVQYTAMRRADGLYDISRRQFCAVAGLTLVVGCVDSDGSIVQTGQLGDNLNPDAGGTHHDAKQTDAPGTNPDSSTGLACTGNPIDVGAASTFVANTPVYHSSGNFFVVRDSGGLYALTAACTHEGRTCVVQGAVFYCPRHGAEFTFNGVVTQGPAFLPLTHYAMCDMSNGHVGVITSQTVSASTRLSS